MPRDREFLGDLVTRQHSRSASQQFYLTTPPRHRLSSVGFYFASVGRNLVSLFSNTLRTCVLNTAAAHRNCSIPPEPINSPAVFPTPATSGPTVLYGFDHSKFEIVGSLSITICYSNRIFFYLPGGTQWEQRHGPKAVSIRLCAPHSTQTWRQYTHSPSPPASPTGLVLGHNFLPQY